MDEQTTRDRTCLNLVRYENEALALDAAVRLMAGRADRPLYSRPCGFCLGFHLTADDKGGRRPVVPLLHAGAGARIFMPHEAPGRGKRRRRTHLHTEIAVRRRVRRTEEQAAEAALSRIPVPRIASPEETAKFFAIHGQHVIA